MSMQLVNMKFYKNLKGFNSFSIIIRRKGVKLMKRFLGAILLIITIIGLSACGKGEDMSGDYYFERSIFVSNEIGRLTLLKASEDGMKYNAFEAIPGHPPASEGELVLNDKSYLDITMSHSSNEIYEFDAGIDLSAVKGVKYKFKKGVLTLDEVFEFHRDDTDKGKELQKLWNAGPSDDEFEEMEKEDAWENKESDNEDSYATAAEEYYSNSCASCHGNDLTGVAGPDISSIGSNLSAEEIEKVIIDGQGAMPPGMLPEDEARVVAEWLSEMK